MSILLGQGFSFNSFISNFSTHYNSEWPISLLVVKKKKHKKITSMILSITGLSLSLVRNRPPIYLLTFSHLQKRGRLNGINLVRNPVYSLLSAVRKADNRTSSYTQLRQRTVSCLSELEQDSSCN